MNAFLNAVTSPQRLIGSSILRAALGTIIAFLYVQNIPWRSFLWGPDGMVPWHYAPQLHEAYGPNLYFLNPSYAWFEIVFWTGLLITVFFAAGITTPLTTALCAVFTWCLIARNPYVADAGWNLVRIMLIYLVFVDTGRYLTPFVLRTSGRAGALWTQLRGLLHNAGLVLILWQLCLVYAMASFYKITGHKWQDGTAVYYVLRSNQFNVTALGSVIWHSAFLVVVGTYGALLFQAAFPFWIWVRPMKYAVGLGAVAFHLGIAYTMALPFFSAIMIFSEAIIFSDADYRRAFAWLRGLVRRPGGTSLRTEEVPALKGVAS